MLRARELKRESFLRRMEPDQQDQDQEATLRGGEVTHVECWRAGVSLRERDMQ